MDHDATLLPQTVLDDMSSFDPDRRRAALTTAIRDCRGRLPAPARRVNLHAHTFYSYSSLGYSPSRLVWEAARRGLAVIGSTDFDVLDAMGDMYEAGDALDIPATVSLETRAYAEAYCDMVVNSPGEPGVVYVMGVGFTSIPDADGVYRRLLSTSRSRNQDTVRKVNTIMAEAAIDYDRDVLPLTPSGNATERHICAAYDRRAREVHGDQTSLETFWSERLGTDREAVHALLAQPGAMQNRMRGILMKQGGVGYTRPDKETFPGVAEFFRMVLAAGAVPCLAWLDGASDGESDPSRLLDDAVAWGARAVNIIPDRNWNIPGSSARAVKTAALERFVSEARRRGLPIISGTELNSPGQKFVDDYNAPEMLPYVDDFMNGAWWLYGHTLLARHAGKGVGSTWERQHFAGDIPASSAFYRTVGERAGPPSTAATAGLDSAVTPDDVLTLLGNAG